MRSAPHWRYTLSITARAGASGATSSSSACNTRPAIQRLPLRRRLLRPGGRLCGIRGGRNWGGCGRCCCTVPFFRTARAAARRGPPPRKLALLYLRLRPQWCERIKAPLDNAPALLLPMNDVRDDRAFPLNGPTDPGCGVIENARRVTCGARLVLPSSARRTENARSLHDPLHSIVVLTQLVADRGLPKQTLEVF